MSTSKGRTLSFCPLSYFAIFPIIRIFVEILANYCLLSSKKSCLGSLFIRDKGIFIQPKKVLRRCPLLQLEA